MTDSAVKDKTEPAPPAPKKAKVKAVKPTVVKEFEVTRADLAAVLAGPARAATSKNTALPALSGLLFEFANGRLSVTGTDLDLTVTSTCTVKGRSTSKVLVPSKLIAAVANRLPADTVTLTVDGDTVTVRAGEFAATVSGTPASEFPGPACPECAEGNVVDLDTLHLLAAVEKVAFASSDDQMVPILNTVLFRPNVDGPGMTLVATDRYRLAVAACEAQLPAADDMLVPTTALTALSRLVGDVEKVECVIGVDKVMFTAGPHRLVTRTVPGAFPDYKQLMPAGFPGQPQAVTVVVNRQHLADAVRRVGLICDDLVPIRLAFSRDGIRLDAAAADVGVTGEQVEATVLAREVSDDGETVEPVEAPGPVLTMAVKARYLTEALASFADDDVTIALQDAAKQFFVHGARPAEHVHLLMPVRL